MNPTFFKNKKFRHCLTLLVFSLGFIHNDVLSQGHVVAIAPTKMNVLYLGVDNPVTIAVEGVKKENVKVSISNGKILERGNGQYIVRPSQKGTAKISVSVGNKSVGSYDFRIKLVPDPIPCIAQYKDGAKVSKNQILAIGALRAEMPNFDFDLAFKITSFIVSASVEGMSMDAKQTNGSRFTDKQLEIIRQAKIGSKIYFSDIKAVGPDGIIRDLPTYYVQIM